MSRTQPFGVPFTAKVLVIGHDPRLKKSNRIAKYPFFADLYFSDKPKPTSGPEKEMYGLAESLFTYIGYLTSSLYSPQDLLITNLCNEELPHAPQGRTVLIPEEYAKRGIEEIRQLISSAPNLELMIAMSQQANYWLQKFGLYSSTEEYLSKSEPKSEGVAKGYYEPKGYAPFREICGQQYFVGHIPLFPVLHVIQFPFRNGIKVSYESMHIECIKRIQLWKGRVEQAKLERCRTKQDK